ncbi:hypothetical protein ABH926_001379 [Catenulispora sp. GP43]|uniref:DUF4383 domain-containing protein n=1 Tax=Catenulispora sp. GP43 TaxID=3156263 RepID=UPI003514F306
MVALQEHLPPDHRLGQVYRWGSILSAVVLLVFGIMGLLDSIPFFGTRGEHVMGMSSNGLLSVASIATAVLLLAAARIGGNVASTVNMIMGVVFILAGLMGLAVMDTKANFLAFGLSNVFFSFVVGLIMMTFGMYGRVNLYLPYDNPYYQARHPDVAELAQQQLAQGQLATAPAETLAADPQSPRAALNKLRTMPPKTTA